MSTTGISIERQLIYEILRPYLQRCVVQRLDWQLTILAEWAKFATVSLCLAFILLVGIAFYILLIDLSVTFFVFHSTIVHFFHWQQYYSQLHLLISRVHWWSDFVCSMCSNLVVNNFSIHNSDSRWFLVKLLNIDGWKWIIHSIVEWYFCGLFWCVSLTTLFLFFSYVPFGLKGLQRNFLSNLGQALCKNIFDRTSTEAFFNSKYSHFFSAIDFVFALLFAV